MPSLDLDYPNIIENFRHFLVPGRTEAHAFLIWFLHNYFRLDEIEAIDAVCDGFDDKGIDGLYVDENLETIDVFQSKIVKNPDKTLGDSKLKEFIGTLTQFDDPDKVKEIAATTSNAELANLIVQQNIAKKITDGFEVKGIFVINIERDQNAIDYLDKCEEKIALFDKPSLESSYIPVGPSAPIGTPANFDIFGYDCAEYTMENARVVLAPLKGNELVSLDGISTGELFAWNVRGTLGRTKVNKDIGRSIEDQNEHKNFLLFHNGLTILCQSLEVEDDKIGISDYSVVNGCQSLTSLFDHRNKITDDLRILTRLIELPPEHELAEKITHHSNNQNPINARDLQSNSAIQRRLQNEFDQNYTGEIFYRIKRGEQEDQKQIIDNDIAGRLLLAFDLKQPWTCHQSYKLFDELHAEIFARPEVNAHRIVAITDVQASILESMESISNRLFASYSLTKYFFLYLVREALESDGTGKEFCATPERFIGEEKGRERLRYCILKVSNDLIIDLNAELKERDESDNPIDYKRELKSPNPVYSLTRNILPHYQKAVARERATSFGAEWHQSEGLEF